MRDVVLGHLQDLRNAVEFGVLVGDSHAVGIKIKGADRLVTQLDRRDGQDSGSGADIEHGLRRLGIPEDDELLEAESGGCMLACAEAQSRVENHQSLALFRCAAAPGGFDQQARAEIQRLEMALPRLGPIAGGHLFDLDSRRRDINPIGGQSLQALTEAAFDASHIAGGDLPVNTHCGQSGDGVGE